MTARVKAKKSDDCFYSSFFFGFLAGLVLGVFLMTVSNDLHGGLLSEALEKYTVCLRLQAPELNCRRTYFYLEDERP